MTAPIMHYRLRSFAHAAPLTRKAFKKRLLAIMTDCRLLWYPEPGDAATSTSEDANARTITWDGDVADRITALGRGFSQLFQFGVMFGTMPDTANMSFGNGTVDQAFSIVAMANVTNTAVQRDFVSKWNGPGALREWQLVVSATDFLVLNLFDESSDGIPFRTSDGAITMGSWTLFGGTYSAATGGATAANDIVLYQNGIAVASTATNAAGYAAMEDLTGPPEIGSQNAGGAGPMDGNMAMVAVCGGVLTAAQMLAIRNLCRQFYGVAL
jgi:hypothetical protein